jgi:histidinol phosphatase-like PHP family hydrolase
LLLTFKVIDFHCHTFFSDGVLGPSELAQRARLLGYSVLGITDHADFSNLSSLISKAKLAAESLGNVFPGFRVLPGVELTHVPPSQIPDLIAKARDLGAFPVIVHGETPVEPVEPGTNLMAIQGKADILAHPGFLSVEEACLAQTNGVYLEISARAGHSLTNGWVVKVAQQAGAKVVINSDTHAPEDLLTPLFQEKVGLGAGLTPEEFRQALGNAQELADKFLGL